MQQRNYSISSYTYNEVYYSPINVPFSWEYKPGLSKITHQRSRKDAIRHAAQFVLSPPPCSLTVPHRVREVEDEKQIPLILCSVQPITSFRKDQKKDDPFLEAYKNCTQSPLKLARSRAGKRTFNCSFIRKCMRVLSCYS